MIQENRGQSIGEYAITISLVILAIMAMTYFIQRGLAARINDGRRYMLDTLDPDIRDVHLWRGGKPYPRMRTEYEPYYLDKRVDTGSDLETNVFINGTSGQYNWQTKSETNANILSRELPAPTDDD